MIVDIPSSSIAVLSAIVNDALIHLFILMKNRYLEKGILL